MKGFSVDIRLALATLIQPPGLNLPFHPTVLLLYVPYPGLECAVLILELIDAPLIVILLVPKDVLGSHGAR